MSPAAEFSAEKGLLPCACFLGVSWVRPAGSIVARVRVPERGIPGITEKEASEMMRRRRGTAGVALCLWLAVRLAAAQAGERAPSGPAPVNPHASPEARALLRYLDSISGKYTITGQHNFPNVGSRWTDRIDDLTGKYPGLPAAVATAEVPPASSAAPGERCRAG
jgi:hypothetical protein